MAWHIFLLTDSPLQVGLIGLFRIVPFMALSFVGGATADVMSRKRILLITQGSLLLLSGLLTLASLAGLVTPWGIYAVTLLAGAASAFDAPARQSLIPNLVPRHELSNALTLNTLLRQTASIVGPGIGGLVIGQFGLTPTYAINTLSFVGVIAAVLCMGPVPRAASRAVGGWERVLGGLRYARQEPLILSALALDFTVGMLTSYRALLPVFARDILAVGPQGLGLLYGATSAGAVAGGVALGAVGEMKRPITVLLATSSIQGLFMVGFGFSQVFAFSLLMLFFKGVANVIAEVLLATVVQLRTPDELRGRVTALNMIFVQGGPQLGQVGSGALASAVGPIAATAIGGTAVVLAVAGFWRLPSMRHGTIEARD